MIENFTTEVLRFGFGEPKLGLALVAVSNRGVAAILLGSNRQKLRRELGNAFKDMQLVEDEAGLTGEIAKVVEFVTTRAALSSDSWVNIDDAS